MKKLFYLLAIIILFPSCATILNGKYQKVTIKTDSKTEILINGEKVNTENGKYIFKRDGKTIEITAKREGFKDEHVTVMQCNKSPWYIVSWIPFIGLSPLVPACDDGVKSRNYEKEIKIGDSMITLPQKNAEAKKIKLNEFIVDLQVDSIKYRYFPSYRSYKKNENKIAISRKNEKIKIENPIFSDVLNNLLKEKGYIDTTNKVLKGNYSDNLLINATITGYTIHWVNNSSSLFSGMVYVDLAINWQALDYYKIPVFLLKTKTKSGQFALMNKDKYEKCMFNATKDAMEYGFIEFMNSKDLSDLLYDKSQLQLEDSYKRIVIPKSTSYVASLSEAIKSSVSIKNKNGHGSGFIISNDGFVITNYHVISDTTAMKVVMYDETEYDVKIIRVSKINDLALLKIDAKILAPFKISESKNIDIASDIYAIGTPSSLDFSQTLSKGIISAVRKTSDNSKLIQTDASVNAGNSGGAIVDKNGLVIGVVSSKLKGFGIEGVAFGIPGYEIISKLKISIE